MTAFLTTQNSWSSGTLITSPSPGLDQAIALATTSTATSVEVNALRCEDSIPLERLHPRQPMASVSSRYIDKNFLTQFYRDEKDNLFEYGIKITMTAPTSMGQVIDGSPTTREWSFISEDNAINATYMHITDEPTPGTISHLMESAIVLIPRKEKPRAQTVGDEIHVTLPTGEMVIFDAKTKVIKQGAFKEAPIDTNPNRNLRKFMNEYTGEGISLRVDRRGNDPRIGAGNVIITQKGKSCSLPKANVWGGSADAPRLLFSDDQKLVDFLNSKCGKKFNI